MKASLYCSNVRRIGLAGLLLSCALTVHAQGVVQCAQVPCDDVRTVAAPQTGVPVEHDFSATAGTTYYVTLTDVGASFTVSQPLASLKLAVTANDALVTLTPYSGSTALPAANQLVVEGTNPAGSNGVATASFTAASSGTYRLHVVGAPASGHAPGPIGVAVGTSLGGTPLQSWSDAIGPAGAPPATAEGVLQQSFTVATGGAYQISVADLAMPLALQGSPQLIVLMNASVVAVLPDPTNSNALTKSVNLQPGTYQIFALGLAATQADGGLFTASVLPASSGGGAPGFAWAVPVGSTVAVGGAVQLMSGAQYALKLNDLAFPAALSQVAAIAVDISQGTPAATLTASGTQTFVAAGASDSYQVYAAALATDPLGAGSYAVEVLDPSNAIVTGAARPVTSASSTLQPFGFTTDVATAGTYTAALTDLQIPAALDPTDFALVQGGAIVGTALTAPGTITTPLTAGAGSLTLLAFAQSASSAGSLMDLSVTSSGGSLIFDQPQGVGAAFKPTQISITTKGTYQFTLADLAWPASFSQSGGQLIGVLSQGGTVVGQIFGGGTLSSIPVTTAGNYYLSIIATPTGSDKAGTYALNVGAAPAAPAVNLSADATTVPSGGTVHLIWTTTGATSCAASGGGWSGTFTGADATSHTATSPVISATTTFTLTCTGAGGQTAGSVTVNLGAANGGTSGSSKGGGGVLGEGWLLILGLCALRRRR